MVLVDSAIFSSVKYHSTFSKYEYLSFTNLKYKEIQNKIPVWYLSNNRSVDLRLI